MTPFPRVVVNNAQPPSQTGKLVPGEERDLDNNTYIPNTLSRKHPFSDT